MEQGHALLLRVFQLGMRQMRAFLHQLWEGKAREAAGGTPGFRLANPPTTSMRWLVSQWAPAIAPSPVVVPRVDRTASIALTAAAHSSACSPLSARRSAAANRAGRVKPGLWRRGLPPLPSVSVKTAPNGGSVLEQPCFREGSRPVSAFFRG